MSEPRKKKDNIYKHLEYHCDEPIIDSEGILVTWGIAWQRIVARVWQIEEENTKETDEWYLRLTSDNQDKVKDALVEMGFIKNSFLGKEDMRINWFLENMKIRVKNAEDGVNIIRVKKKKNGAESEETVQFITKKDNEAIDPYHRVRGSAKNVDQVFLDNKQKVVDKLPCDSNSPIPESQNPNGKYVMVNGWRNIIRKGDYIQKADKRTEHAVILTIPKRPENESDFGIALADYVAAGKIFPCTCCLT